MSTINRKPFIKDLLGSLSDEDIETLSALIDGGGNQTPILRTLSIKPAGNRTHISESDMGVHLCSLEVNYTLIKGYLLYNDDYCVLISFSDSQKLSMFAIDVDTLGISVIDEELSVLELRSELTDYDVYGALDFASDEDVYIALAIVEVGDREIEDNALILEDADTIEGHTLNMA